jgi:glycosyltransferase involved in cell wall biosynthesis
VGHEELQKAYAEASFWTYPCDQAETFCITAIRAQLAGAVPVILVNSALSETVRHGYRCLKKEEYLPTLLKAMRNAEKITLEQRKEMGQFVLEEYTWDKFALSWKDIFNKPSKQIAKLCFTP